MATVKAFDGKKVSYKGQANNGGVPVTFDGKKVSFAKPQYQYQQDFIGPVRIEDTPMGAIMAQNKAYEQARHNAIYGNTDVSNYQYQTVGEYDAEIAKLQKQYDSTNGYNYVYDHRGSGAVQSGREERAGEKDALKAQIDALKAQRNLLERALLIGNRYGNIRSTADFDAKSGVTRHDEDMTYVAVNRDAYSQFPEEYNDIGWVDGGYVTTENMAELARKYGWSSKEATMRLASADDLRTRNEQRSAEIEAARKSHEFAMLTDDERAVYNYLYNVSGKNAANEYLDDMKVILEKRYTTAEQLDNIDRYDRAGDFGKAVMNIATIPANLVGAVVAAINDVSEGVSGNYSPYGTAHSLQNYADTIRGETATDINEAVKNAGGGDTLAQLASTLYQAGMSGADAMLGGATLGSGYLFVAGANAATHKAKELYESGAEGWQIAVGSVASGALEAAIEKLPLDNLLAMKNAGGADNLSAILKNILKQSGLEGSEEAITELANLAADCVLQGGNSDLSRQIAAYESEGHSSKEARKMALRDKASDVLWATVAGMGSGGGSAAVFSSIGYGNMLRDTANLGRAFLDAEGGLDTAIGIGLDNARTTQAYKSAQAMAQRVEDGKGVSAYQVGKMLRDSQTADAQKARALDHAVRQSAVEFDVSDDVTDMVADIAAGTGRQIVFGDLSATDGKDAEGGKFDPNTGIITINASASAEQVVNFLVKHELAHSIEGTKQWEQLADIVQARLGDEKWSTELSAVMERYAANGEDLDLPRAEYEVVANWIGDNLYKSGFAQAIVKGDATVGNAFVQVIDKMRLAMGNKKSRSHTNLAVVERLFMRALENEVQPREGNNQYAIITLDDGKIYVQADRKVLTGTDKETWKDQIDTFFDKVLLQNGSLTVESIEGDELTITKDETVWKGKDEHIQIQGKKRNLTKGEYFIKLQALSHIDELSEASAAQKNKDGSQYIAPDEKSHSFAKDGFSYRTVYFQDFDGKYYRVTLSVGLNDGISTVYNVGQIKETAAPEGEIISVIGSKARGATVSDTRVAQNVPSVKNYSMQETLENSPNEQKAIVNKAWMQGDDSVDREGNTLDEGEQGPKKRQFYEKRERGTDANQSEVAVEKLKEHSETYTPVSNQETLEKAKEKLRNPEYSRNLQRRILKFNKNDMFNSVDVAAAEVMINDAFNDGDLDLYMKLIAGASRKGTELGRAVQAFAMQARLTPEGMLRAAQRTTRKTENKILFDGADEQLDIAAQKVVDTLEQMLKNGNIQPEQVLHILKNLDKVEVPEQISRAIKEAVTRSERKVKSDAAKKGKTGSDADAWTLAPEITEDAANDGLNDTEIRDYLTDLLGLPRLTNEETAKLIDAASRMQNAEEDSVEWQQAMDEAYTLLASKIPNTKWEVLTEWRKFAMLFNVKTHIRNVSSNLGYQGVRSLDSMNATLLEKLAVRLKLMTPEQRNAQFGWSLTEQGRQLMQSGKLQEAAEAALAEKEHRGQKYGPEQGTLQPYRKYFKPEWLEKLRTWNYGMLGKGDNPFFKNAYVNALGQYMVAHGETEISEAGKDFAFERALEAIFAADNWMSDLISEAKRSKIGGAVDVVIPFHKTPANIATQSFYHSPIGLVKGAFDLYGAVKGKNGKTAAEAINTIAKGMTGVTLWGIGILLGSFGLFNTGWGKTEKERAADELAGIQENSFQIGNISITLDWLQPTAAPLIMGASMAQRIREDGMSLGSMFGAVMDGTDSLFELTMLQSLYDILGGYDAGASATVASVAENVVSQSIPTLLGQAARAIDPVQRKTTGDSDFETIVNQVMAKVPGLTYLLEPQLDVWGNEVYRTGKADATGTVLNAFQQAILPMNVKRATGDDAISQLILALYEDQGSRAIPSEPTREKADELGMDYAELAKLVGKVNRQAVEDLTANKVRYTVQRENAYGKKKNVDLYWSDMTDDERARVLSRIYTETKKQVEEPDDDYFEQLIRAVQGG